MKITWAQISMEYTVLSWFFTWQDENPGSSWEQLKLALLEKFGTDKEQEEFLRQECDATVHTGLEDAKEEIGPGQTTEEISQRILPAKQELRGSKVKGDSVQDFCFPSVRRDNESNVPRPNDTKYAAESSSEQLEKNIPVPVVRENVAVRISGVQGSVFAPVDPIVWFIHAEKYSSPHKVHRELRVPVALLNTSLKEFSAKSKGEEKEVVTSEFFVWRVEEVEPCGNYYLEVSVSGSQFLEILGMQCSQLAEVSKGRRTVFSLAHNFSFTPHAAFTLELTQTVVDNDIQVGLNLGGQGAEPENEILVVAPLEDIVMDLVLDPKMTMTRTNTRELEPEDANGCLSVENVDSLLTNQTGGSVSETEVSHDLDYGIHDSSELHELLENGTQASEIGNLITSTDEESSSSLIVGGHSVCGVDTMGTDSLVDASEVESLSRCSDNPTSFLLGSAVASSSNESNQQAYINNHLCALERWNNPPWYSEVIPSASYDSLVLRWVFKKAIVKRLMTNVPFGALQSGELDSTLAAAIVFQYLVEFEAGYQWGSHYYTFCLGLKDFPDLKSVRKVADYLRTRHYEFQITMQERIVVLVNRLRRHGLLNQDCTFAAMFKSTTPSKKQSVIKFVVQKPKCLGEVWDTGDCMGDIEVQESLHRKELHHNEELSHVMEVHLGDKVVFRWEGIVRSIKELSRCGLSSAGACGH